MFKSKESVKLVLVVSKKLRKEKLLVNYANFLVL